MGLRSVPPFNPIILRHQHLQTVLDTAEKDVFTSAGKSMRIVYVRFCNTTGGALTVNFRMIPKDDRKSETRHALLATKSISANDIYEESRIFVLPDGWRLSAWASADGIAMLITMTELPV